MRSESIDDTSNLSIGNFSFETLQTAKWEELERFTIEVLKRYYKPFGLSISRTEKSSAGDVGSDGSRDGEATIIFASSPEQSVSSSAEKSLVQTHLGIVITLWVEVKKRSQANVDHHDLGGTIFRSSLEYVTKIIFVSNRNFTKGFREALERYAVRNGRQFSLIDGHSLIQIAEKVSKEISIPEASPPSTGLSQSQAPVSAQLRFTLDPVLRYSDVSRAEVERAVNEPIFLVADCKVAALTPPYPNLRIELEYLSISPLTIIPRSGNDQQAIGAGDHFRAVFAIFPSNPCNLSLDSFDLQIIDQEGKRIDCEVTKHIATCLVRGTILPDLIPPSRMTIHQELRSAIKTWLNSSRSQAVDILAIAGAGKSHLVRGVRKTWLRLGAYEVFLDGGSEQTATAAALALLGQVFPIPMDEVTSELSSILTEWLTRSGLPEGSAMALAQHVCSQSEENKLPFNNAQLGYFLALILTKQSEQHPIILIFEDLHKCLPSSITMLKALRQRLEQLGGGKVFTLFTTREDSVWDDEAVRRDWRDSMERMRIGSDITQLWIEPFTSEEAKDIVKAAIPTIEEHYTEAIINQVGTTPFGIREALGLLLERQVLESDGKNGVWRLTNPDGLVKTLDSQEFRRATHYRLRGLRERYPEWLGDFLDSGACLGQLFDPEICARNAGGPTQAALESALAECRFLEVIRFSLLVSSRIRFDHDLIRQVLLQDMGAFRQRRLTKTLFEALKDQESSNVLSSLAYQAGLGDECWIYTLKQADTASRAMRHMEAVHALGLALTVTDHNIVTKIFDVQKGRYRPSFDEAIAVAEPCSRNNLDRESRERETAHLLLRYIEHLVAVGSGGTPSVDKALTEGGMLAERLGDKTLRATLKMFQGRQMFNRDQPVEALRLHEAAENIFTTIEMTDDVNSKRALNLVRLAIALRSNGQLKESRQRLVKAMRERISIDWSLATQVRANFGATFFYTDWDKTRHHWQRATRIAKQRGLIDRYVHGLIDVASLDLLEDLIKSAEQALEEALMLSRDYGFENSELRCLLNLGCLALIQGEPKQALELLREADRLGFRHGVGRRLWRVRANMATAYFALGETERSLATDRITLHSMPPLEGETSLLDHTRFFAGTRLVLALANIALRAEKSEGHRELLLAIPPSAQQLASELAERVIKDHLEHIPALRGRHCKRVNGERFFLITE